MQFVAIDLEQKKLLEADDFDHYLERVCNPNEEQRTQNLIKLNSCANEMGRICSQRLDDINSQIIKTQRKRSAVDGRDGVFCFNLRRFISLKKLVSIITKVSID